MTAKEALEIFDEVPFTVLNPPSLNPPSLYEIELAYEILKELVERDIPIKVCSTIVDFSHVDYHCPKCNEYVDVGFANGFRLPDPYNFCPECGQRLEWEE